MANYMESVAEMLGVKLHVGFYVIHDNGRSLVVLEEEGIRFINHIGCLKEDAPAICLQEILNGNFRIEHIEESQNKETTKHGHWKLLDECSNAGVYCSVCSKKVYRTDYANQKIKSKYCPNCGSIMDEEFEVV